MTRDELYALARRVYDAAYGVIVGPTSKGGTMSETQDETQADPRDAEIAALKQQLADAEAAKSATDTAKGDTTADEPEAPAAPVEVTYEEAKAKVDANENLTDADVAALERGPSK